MDLDLTANEIRVLFCLFEKEHTTPDQYPLSTNSLRLACNQKTSRDPVLDLSENEIDAALLSLRERKLVRSSKPTGSRAWKHRHVTNEVIDLGDDGLAVLSVLGLRGAQTSGELRQRTERLHSFDETSEVDETLTRLAARQNPLVRNVGREPGQSQDRWEHLLGAKSVTPEEARGHAMAADFAALHESGFFVLPNPWDRGSARMLQEQGAKALATTSAGHGRCIGKDDQEVTRDELIAHVRDLSEFVNVPLAVDSERLFPDAPGGITESVRLLAEAGAAGVSIEDYEPSTGRIDPIDKASEAVAEAAAACATHGLVLTARTENHLYPGGGDLEDSIERLQAYERAGASCLYAPGLVDIEEIERVVSEVNTPINVLALRGSPDLEAIAAAGVRRVSTGSVLYQTAMNAAREQAITFLR